MHILTQNMYLLYFLCLFILIATIDVDRVFSNGWGNCVALLLAPIVLLLAPILEQTSLIKDTPQAGAASVGCWGSSLAGELVHTHQQ